jgi:hypothetical protein
MKGKLRRMRLEETDTKTFELMLDGEWLKPISVYHKFSREIERKQELAEKESQRRLYEIHKRKHVVKMVYPKKLTKLNDCLKDAWLGKNAHKNRWYAPYREKHQGKLKYSKKWIQHQNLKTLLDGLDELAQDEKSRKIIAELKGRFENFAKDEGNFDKKIGRFFKLLHEIKGTKLDFIGVGERCDKCGERKVIFYDAKYWDETKYKKPSVKWKDLKYYVEFSKAGIPYHLLIFNIHTHKVFGCEIKSLPIPKDMDDEDYYPIERKYLYEILKKDSGEKSSSI